jgi:hypothetical protein
MINSLFTRKFPDDGILLDKMIDQLVESEPILLFSNTECQECWGIKKLFNTFYVDFRIIELDDITYGNQWQK